MQEKPKAARRAPRFPPLSGARSVPKQRLDSLAPTLRKGAGPGRTWWPADPRLAGSPASAGSQTKPLGGQLNTNEPRDTGPN
jgi:hypothetical protein